MSTTKMSFKAVQSALAQIKGVSFVSIKGYTNELGEVQNQLINIGYSLEKAKNADFEYLMSLNFSGKDEIFETARIELIKAHKIASYLKFYGGDRDFAYIAGMVSQFLVNCETSADINCTAKDVQSAFNRSKAQKDAYIILDNGFKYSEAKDEYYIYGFQVRDKVVTEKAEIEKADTRSALTKAKDMLRSKLKGSKFRQFKISEITILNAMGETIVVNE